MRYRISLTWAIHTTYLDGIAHEQAPMVCLHG